MKKIPEDLESFDNYREAEEVFRHFFRCSLYDRWDCFDWNEAFDFGREKIGQKLHEHGLTNYEDFKESYYQMYGSHPGDLSPFVFRSDYIYVSEEEILDVILKHLFKECQEAFSGMFTDLMDLYDKTENPDRFDLPERIEIFDSVIHAQHVTGAIFDYFNPDDLREAVEIEYDEQEEENELSETINQFHND